MQSARLLRSHLVRHARTRSRRSCGSSRRAPTRRRWIAAAPSWRAAARARRDGRRCSPQPRARRSPPRADSDRRRRPVLLLGHFDTVWPVGTLERMPLREERRRLHGPGIFDMKAGIAHRDARRRARCDATGTPHPPHRRCSGRPTRRSAARRRATLIEEEARRGAAVLVLEPSLPGGAVKTSAQGLRRVRADRPRRRGARRPRSRQGGERDPRARASDRRRSNALQDLARGISVNVGVVSGGTAAERRRRGGARGRSTSRAPTLADADARRGGAPQRCTRRRPRTRLTVSGGFDRPPLERTAAVVASVRARARRWPPRSGSELREGSDRRRLRREFHRRARCSHVRWPRRDGDGAHARARARRDRRCRGAPRSWRALHRRVFA